MKGKDRYWMGNLVPYCPRQIYIVMDLLKALLGNSSVNTFQQPTMGAVFSVDECYSSLLGSTTILVTEVFLCGPRHATVCVFHVVRAGSIQYNGVCL
jgi:hypothetical protein